MIIPPKIRVAAVGLLVLAVIALYVSIRHAATISKLIALVSTAQDEALGVDWSKVRASRNIAATVPELEAALGKAKAAGTKAITGVRITSGDTPFIIPDWRPEGGLGAPVAAGEAATSQPPPLLVSGEVQGAVVALADGSIQQTWKMFATLKRGEWSERKMLCGGPGDPCTADVAIDPAFKTLLDTYGKPTPVFSLFHKPKLWRMGTSCGIGVDYGLVSRGIDVSVACVYGIQF